MNARRIYIIFSIFLFFRSFLCFPRNWDTIAFGVFFEKKMERQKCREKCTLFLQPLLLTAYVILLHWCAAMAMCLTTITILFTTMNFLCTCIPYSVCVQVYSTLLCIIIIIIIWHPSSLSNASSVYYSIYS